MSVKLMDICVRVINGKSVYSVYLYDNDSNKNKMVSIEQLIETFNYNEKKLYETLEKNKDLEKTLKNIYDITKDPIFEKYKDDIKKYKNDIENLKYKNETLESQISFQKTCLSVQKATFEGYLKYVEYLNEEIKTMKSMLGDK